ncbi:hypothetical protein [Macrococcus armenti]|nr:hypothetical protein [Macrococcus armenti]UBH11311.1 hypothetical protein LAU38_02265 [Macrococcus armenti]
MDKSPEDKVWINMIFVGMKAASDLYEKLNNIKIGNETFTFHFLFIILP